MRSKPLPILKFLLFLTAGIWLPALINAQPVPELIYYKFDAAGTSVTNEGSAPVSPSGTVQGTATIGGAGQFGTALVGSGATTASNSVNTNWPLNLSGAWTISMWFSGVTNALTSNYLFGGSGGTTFRALTGSGVVAGAGNLEIRSTGMTDVFLYNIFDASGTPVVVHFVYDPAVPAIKGYVNGVLTTTVAQPSTLTLTGTNFTVGGQAATTGLPAGAMIDEFRLYNRALTDAEITATWNITLPGGPCPTPPVAGTATSSPSSGICAGSNVTLSLSGNSNGSGQTYQWEESAVPGGPYTPIGSSSTTPGLNITATASMYYRAAVTCSGNTTYSTEVFVSVPPAFPAGTYTINSAVATGGSNFQTFADAVSAISCGISGPIVFDVVSGSGPYNEQVTLPATIGSSAANTVTFNGNGATVSFAGTAAAPHTFGLNGSDYITVNNLNIVGTDVTYALVCHLWNQADNNNFNNCTFSAPANSTPTTTVAFCLNGGATVTLTAGPAGDNNVLTGCTLNSGYYSAVFYGSSSTGNQLLDCQLMDYYFYGAYVYGQNGMIVRGNNMERPTRTNPSTFYGVYVVTGSTNVLVENNRIHNPFGGLPVNTSTAYGIYSSVDATAGAENKYINNVISNFQGNGTHGGIYLTGADYVQVYHNTVSFDYSAATAGTTYGIYSTGTTAGIDIRNNNISIARGGTGTKYCLYYSGGLQTSNNNNLYINAPAGANHTGFFSTAQTLLANWQAVNGGIWDAASIAVDPLYVNPVAGDYTPTNSLMDDLGTPVGVLADINAAPRSATTPDIGAYEFSVAACVGFPVPGTATSNVPSVCASGPFSITLTGFTIGSGIVIQWEESPAGLGNWVPITGANSATLNYTQTVASDYRAIVTCVNGGFSDISNTVTIQMSPFFLCYCSPLTGTPLHTTTGNYITNVTIPGTPLSASTAAIGAGGYTQHDHNVSTNTASLIQGQSYTLNASIASATYGTELWIDWDQSGTFDATEYQLLTPGTIATTTISVPATATPGLTGMRLRNYVTTAHGASGSCASLSSGRETEDFVITIAPAIQCAGIPTVTGTATISQTNICVNNSVELDVTGYTTDLGISIQWEESPAGQNNWSIIPGATTPNYTVPNVLGDMDYRAAVICNSPGGGTGYSNTVSVVANNPQITGTTPASRCGTGTVDLAATASPGNVVNWYDVATGGSPLATGNNFTTPVISTTTTFYAAATTPGASAASMPLPAHASNFTGNVRGFYFTAPTSFTITGLQALAQTTGDQSIAIVKFDNNTPPPIYSATTNAFTVLYLTQNNPATGVIPVNIPINAGEVIGVLGQVANASSYATPVGQYVSSIAGLPVTLTRMGMQFSLNTSVPQSLWEETGAAIGRVLIEYQDGCEGLRVPVAATITPAPAITVTTTPDTICIGSSATLEVSSSNAGYNYTWTPGGPGSTITVSPTTTTSYEIVATDASNCSQIDTIEVAVISVPPSVATVASISSVCVTGSVDLSLDPVPMAGISVQWQKDPGTGFTDIPGATLATYSESVTATADYRAQLFCNGTLVTSSVPVTVTYANPAILSTTPASRCGSGTVTLGATAGPGDNIDWYNQAAGGSPVGNGSSFTTPIIGSTTTYYVAANNGGSSVYGGRPAPVPTATGYSAGTLPYGMVFDAFQPFTLTSVEVYSSAAAGNLTLVLADNLGNILQTVGPVAIPAGTGTTIANGATPTTVPLNLAITPGTGYRLYTTNLTATLIRENAGLAYPYPLGTVGNVTTSWTNGAAGAANHYFFYNWHVTTGCESPRQAVVATVSPAPGAVFATATPDTICAGTSSTLTASSSFGGYNYSWSPGGGTGSSISISPAFNTSYLLTGTDPISGCQEVDTVDVVVKSAPSGVVTEANPTEICVSGPVTLSMDTLAPFGITYQWQANAGSGFTDIIGATSPTHTETISTATSYQANILCDGNIVGTSAPVTVTVNNPAILETFPGSRCDAGPVTLVATAAPGATINWYAAATGGAPVATGGAYTTPSIATSTTYYAAAVQGGGGLASVGAPNNGQNTGYTLEAGLFFDVMAPSMTINGVYVYPVGTGAGTVEIALKDASAANIQTLVVNLVGTAAPGIQTYVPLNFVVPQGTGYSLVMLNRTGGVANLVRDGAAAITGGGFPFTLPGVMSITSGRCCPLAVSTSYYYFYNWQVSTGCESVRVPVAASINGSASGTGLSTGGTSTGALQADGTTVNYNDGCGDKVVTVTDPAGGNTMGVTSAVVITSTAVKTHNARPFVPRAFDITPTSDGPGTVTLYALQSEFDAYNNYVTTNTLNLPLLPTGPADLAGMLNIAVTQYHGTALSGTTGPMNLYDATNSTYIPNSSITPLWTGSFWSITFPVSGFSGFFIHSGSNTLSIELGDITAKNSGSRNRIDWNTMSEHSGDYFILERSADAVHFNALDRINAKGMAASYSYWDENPFGGVNHYRLKMFDAAGAFSYSKVVTATVKGQGAFTLQASPNPVGDDILNVQVWGQTANNANITVSDITGKTVRTVAVVNNNAKIDMSGLAQGAYLIRYTDAARTETIKVNKQ